MNHVHIQLVIFPTYVNLHPATILLQTVENFQNKVYPSHFGCFSQFSDQWYPAGAREDRLSIIDGSLANILPSPITTTGSRGHPRTELAFLISLSSLFLPAAEIPPGQQTTP